MMQKHF